MLTRNDPDRIQITFGDRCLVANVGLILPPPWFDTLACPNWLTGTWIWAMPRAERTRATR